MARFIAMNPLDRLAERHIAEARERGEFDDLPGAGAPLALGDDSLVPEELRAAYRMLKNAGFVPPEIEGHREIREVEQLLAVAETDEEHARLRARIEFLLSRGRTARPRNLQVDADYMEKLAERLERRKR